MSSHPVWGRGFRPFFLAAGGYGCALTLIWIAIWLGIWPAPAWLAPSQWHAHEMLFGLVAAAIAGFLTTAVPVWTGRPALAGRPLMALAALWSAGRLAMLAAGALPAGLVAGVDLAFLPVLALVLARHLWRTGQRRNYGIVGVILALALANAAVHAQALGWAPSSASRALRLAVDAVVVLIVVIGGRITPAFTANALRMRGAQAVVRARPWLDRLAIAFVVAVAIADLLAPGSAASAALACMAGLLVAARMAGWQTASSWRDPLVASLHAGMAWVAIGLLVVGAGGLGWPLAGTAGLHALTAGAMGSMILAVMTRVALGHTGRPLVLPAGAAGCYLLVHAGAAARVAAGLAPAAQQASLLGAAGLLWAAAFWLFTFVYWRILTAPRIDGKEG
ncbi:MAG TPA: NnrS family protein [Myxococcota bacterium]